MKIIVLGTRGIPDVLGGVETHCQELYPRLVKLGHKITLITRASYTKDHNLDSYQNVKLKQLYAPKSKTFEAIVHTFLGVLYAAIKQPDYLHIHSIGPMLLTPFAKVLGLKVVVTHHGQDYNRQKWGKTAKKILKLGERWGVKYAEKAIVISKNIRSDIQKKYNRNDVQLIPNGVNIPVKTNDTGYLDSLGLKEQKYIIAVGRFVPEKGFSDLIEAFLNIKTDSRLVLVGDADHETEYSKRLKKTAKKNGIVLTGFIKGEKLNQIFSHAQLFVLPSYHEGLPISLLEAMSYNLDVLVSDIPANREVNLNEDDYFEPGNITALKQALQKKLYHPVERNFTDQITANYDWDTIAERVSEYLKED